MTHETQKRPPKIAKRLLQLCLRRDDFLEKSGDLEEVFSHLHQEMGQYRAALWFWGQILKTAPVSVFHLLCWRWMLLRNYIKIAIRTLVRQKTYSSINIFGLALGMVSFLFIYLYVQYEMSYDQFHANKDTIYRVNQLLYYNGEERISAWTPYEIGRALGEEFPEVKASTRIYRLVYMEMITRYGDKVFKESRHRLVDPSFFTIFTYQTLYGHPGDFYSDVNSVVISADAAERYFGRENPIGKILTINDEIDFRISGVVEIPKNTEFRYDLFFPLNAFPDRIDYGWRGLMYQTYVQLHEGVDPLDIERKITTLHRTHLPAEDRTHASRFQPLSRIHFYTSDGRTSELLIYIKLFSIGGIFILIIACINYMNLSTARSEQRAREVGLRKTIGARRSVVARQFIIESFLTSFLALCCTVFIIIILLPGFNQLVGGSLNIGLISRSTVMTLLILWVLTALLSGSYPAVVLSSYHPIRALKNTGYSGGKGSILRKGLVIFQFSLSIIFIISTLVVHDQLRYIQNRYDSFEKEQLIFLEADGNDLELNRIVKNRLKQVPSIKEVTLTQQLPLYIGYTRNVWTSRDLVPENRRDINYNMGDFDYVKTFQLDILEGRDFSENIVSDGMNCLVNESAVRHLGFESPVGKEIVYWDKKIGTIIGIVKDFNYRHVSREIGPLILCARPEWRKNYIVIRLTTENLSEMLRDIRKIWNEVYPGIPCEIQYFDWLFNLIYANEQRMGSIFFYFTGLTIIISCLGLLGLASFTTERRTKEIGIRKVLGASVGQIATLLSADFTRWVMLSNIIAWPVAYIAMHRWLQGFAYRTRLDLAFFILATLAALIVSLVTIMFQTVKASFTNPVNSLKYE